MFQKGRMVIKSAQGLEAGKRVELEWKVSAVMNDNAHKFAKELEQLLNLRTTEGYTLAQMLPHLPDNGLVLVHQKYIVIEDPAVPPVQGAN